MPSRVAKIAVLALGALALAPATVASAQECPEDAQCAKVTVPLDHKGGTPGTLDLAYAKLPATGTRAGTLVLLSGGPGQAALPILNDFAELLEPLRSTYDIVAVDQRGTGGSGAVDCEIDKSEDVAACATQLGNRRAFWSTAETAHDLENLRTALGVDKLTLFGVSYGTQVAQEYVRRYPAQTAAIILDSPTPVDGLDGVDELRTFGAPRVLKEVCYPGICAETVTDASEALAAAVERLGDDTLRGPRVTRSGRVRTARVSQVALYNLIALSDTNPLLRAGLPAAIASLADGDAAPLIHLVEVTAGDGSSSSSGTAISRLLATSCMEARLPWAPDSAVATRTDALKAFVAARSEAFAPFDPEVVLGNSLAELCAQWPPTPKPEGVPYAGPNVPVLILAGRQDLRTPLESARRTQAQYPNARLVAVRSAGHSVLSTDLTGCAATNTVAFLTGEEVRNCSDISARDRAALPSAPFIPASISDLRPTGTSGSAGQTFSAVRVTLTGIAFDTAGVPSSRSFRLPGLRAGYITGKGSSLTLHGVEWVHGVRVSGTLRGSNGTLTVSGSQAAAGTIRFTRTSATGTLGGRTFTVRGS
ncbi:alpha/beta hydrolase [Solirubrobacter sp. CPCC 204708]|uniref:Alpha/beta hydrolase n=1 Tax=Solirubrobacter deserti TaxID=2282478 RepID=A0ABT4RJN5_9ACTN|nr:alpha/beta hydrolase [Solirubrobacter deserti]MBE2319750.1 alpha/beta hydrolase [Solirubrobacter deserti]MDA0138769.1 alpha/beta hydrolase [Solirubrobacter deserti]